jgi:hypothetical protein
MAVEMAETDALRARVAELEERLVARELRAERELQATAAFWVEKWGAERQRVAALAFGTEE